MILVCITFLAGVLYYLLSSSEPTKAFAAFVRGFIFGVITWVILTFIPFTSFEHTASVLLETTHIYLVTYVIPLFIAVPLFLLFSFSVEETTLCQTPAMALGLFTILFVRFLFTNRAEPESFRFEIMLISLFTGVFLYELLLKLFIGGLSVLSPFIAFLLATILFIGLCYPLALILGAYHFTNARYITFAIATITLAVVLLPQRLIALFKK